MDIRQLETEPAGLTELGRLKILRAHDPLPMQAHEGQFEILYTYAGRKIFYIRDCKYALNGGDALLVLPGERHGADDETQNRTTLYYLLFRDPQATPGFLGLDDAERGALSAMLRSPARRRFAAPDGLNKLFEQLFELHGGDSPVRAARMKHFALELIWQVAQAACAEEADARNLPDDIRRVADWIGCNAAAMPTVSELAGMVHLSVPRFKQKFKRATGVPPAEYIIREKISISERLLAGSRKSVTDIAMDLGFCSSQNFSVVFKKYMGESPTSYRASHCAAPGSRPPAANRASDSRA